MWVYRAGGMHRRFVSRLPFASNHIRKTRCGCAEANFVDGFQVQEWYVVIQSVYGGDVDALAIQVSPRRNGDQEALGGSSRGGAGGEQFNQRSEEECSTRPRRSKVPFATNPFHVHVCLRHINLILFTSRSNNSPSGISLLSVEIATE